MLGVLLLTSLVQNLPHDFPPLPEQPFPSFHNHISSPSHLETSTFFNSHIAAWAIICKISVCMLKRYFVPFIVSCEKRGCKKHVFQKMAKTKRMPYRKVCMGDDVTPGTSRDTAAEGEGAKKLEKKGEHLQWISFLNDFNMQYTNEN